MSEPNKPKVTLVGAGPGAPDLLTLRAARLLQDAQVVFYDALVHPDTLALARQAQCIAVGKRCGAHSTAQRFINKRLVDAALTGQRVVRLKGGDPMLFGRAHEEIEALRAAGIEVDVVPGVTAALAAAAEIGVSLTRRARSRSVTFVTPRVAAGSDPSSWLDAALHADTVVCYMAASEIAQVASDLIGAGRARGLPVAVVYGASWPGAATFFTTLDALVGAGLPGVGTSDLPCLICLGEVYREALESSQAQSGAFSLLAPHLASARSVSA